MSAHLDQHAAGYQPYPSLSDLRAERQMEIEAGHDEEQNRIAADIVDEAIRRLTALGPVKNYANDHFEFRDLLEFLSDARPNVRRVCRHRSVELPL